jgi:DNA repair protein RadC
LSGTVADPRTIFQAALLCHATSVLFLHNYPSSNNQPSAADIGLTKKLCEAGKVLEITVLDHIIVTVEGFYSFAEEGLI